jgi:hypothetical protein
MLPDYKITREMAIVLINELAPKFETLGFYLGLTGGCLFRGGSNKDIDIIAYPFGDDRDDKTITADQLKALGFEIKADTSGDACEGSNNGDDMIVFVTLFNNVRVDLFILS